MSSIWIRTSLLWMCIFFSGCRLDSAHLGEAPGWVDDLHIKELPPPLAAQTCCLAAREWERQGQLVEAMKCYEEARKLDPKVYGAVEKLAALSDKTGEPEKADKLYQEAVRARPQDAKLRYEVALFHYRNDHLSEAEHHLQETVRLAPDHREAWEHLGKTLARRSRFEESLVAFQKVYPEPEAKLKLGLALHEVGREKEGREFLREAIKEEPMLAKSVKKLLPAELLKPTSGNEEIVPVRFK